MVTPKEEAKSLIDSLPKEVTWDEIMYGLYVRSKISNSLQQADERNVLTHKEVKKYFL